MVTSNVLTQAKRNIAAGLGERLVGIAAVPAVPQQVGLLRHIWGLVVYGGLTGLPHLALGAVARRVAAGIEPLVRPAKPWTPRALARQRRLTYLSVPQLSDKRLFQWLGALQCDLVLSLQSHRVNRELLAIPHLGWLNLHHGRLPDYRGAFSVFWAMANREPAVYLTAHLMGEELDCGPIVAEQALEVPHGSTVTSMERRMWEETPALVLLAVARLERGPAAAQKARLGGRLFGYPSRGDLREARRNGVLLR